MWAWAVLEPGCGFILGVGAVGERSEHRFPPGHGSVEAPPGDGGGRLL